MPTPPAAMRRWCSTSIFDGTPPLAMPSLVVDLMKRLRSVSGPILSGVKALRAGCACAMAETENAGIHPAGDRLNYMIAAGNDGQRGGRGEDVEEGIDFGVGSYIKQKKIK